MWEPVRRSRDPTPADLSIESLITSCTSYPRGWLAMTANLLTLNSSKMEFLLIGLQKQLAKIHNCSLNTTDSARNLSFIFDIHLTFSDQLPSLSKSCYYHIREFRCIRPYLDFKTASIIATSIVHSIDKLVYCNSVLQPSKISNKSSSGYSELSCPGCG